MHSRLSTFIIVNVLIFMDCADAIDSETLTQRIRSNRTIIVDANGKGDFKSVQAAIDYVPNSNSEWIMIHISKGVYRERVKIARNKPYIFMRGEGIGKTSIESSPTSANDYDSATFKVEARNFIAFGISFKNGGPSGLRHSKAVAAVVGADKAAFYHCAFLSNHNTLFDSRGRHYYASCYLQGSIDLVFGHAQSFFYDCEVFVVPNLKSEIGGSIAASHRQRGNASSGFVFVKCRVYGVGDVYLGRAKGTHSRVVFADSYLSNTVVSHGWTDWSFPHSKDHLHLAEYNCHGPGSASENRADWSKQLTYKEAMKLITIDFIRGKEWLPAWPYSTYLLS